MSEKLELREREEAGSVLSTSLLLGAVIGTAQLAVLLVRHHLSGFTIIQQPVETWQGISKASVPRLFSYPLSALTERLRLQVFGQQMIRATGCAAELVAPAWQYLKIRAFSAPSVLLLMVAQVCQATQSSRIAPSVHTLCWPGC